MTWERFFAWLMQWEGRTVTSNPKDPGGQTAWGISRRYNPHWPGWELVDAGKASTPAFETMVSNFYAAEYGALWKALPPRLNAVVVDTAVNMGSAYAIKALQTAMNRLACSDYVTVDGMLGPQTMAAIKACDPSATAFCMCAVRLAEYGRRGRKGDARRVFLDGWINRVRSLMEVI